MAQTMDPNILAAHEDPSLRFLAHINTFDPPPTAPGDDFEDSDREEPGGSTSELASIKDVSMLIKIIKRRKKLSNEANSKLDTYAQMTLPEERAALLFAEVVEIVDIMKSTAQHRVEEWKISENLKKSITTFAKGIILSPTITMYRGNGPAEKVLRAMQALGIRDLPNPDDIANLQKVLAEVRHQLTIARNQVKTRIHESLEEDSLTRNVGDLAMLLTAGTSVQPTLQFLIRLAFLRWHAISFADLEENQWWPRVDGTLKTWRTTCDTELKLNTAFNAMYVQDKEKFGDPTESELQPHDIRNLPAFQLTIDREASKLDTATRAGSKRRRVD
ncbi:hypothetical protein EYR40_010034 [Pleurotus pulmonarius]|nr:hypothetical protein EYR36_010569 [Pleurotus pulmonarius]KAF4588483.1 hypothetical protein EYR40_010034 [Pleurotus pulmonarius]